jgi:thiamine biosynthesis protein ThiI
MMAKRGLKLSAVHFFSYPYTSADAKNKVIELAKILTKYCNSLNLYIVPFTAIQEDIRAKCEESFTITIMRRFMMRICNMLAEKIGAGAVVTGESLGQVASQTMQGMRVTDEMAVYPVFRPLIGMDKEEIIAKAKAIGTFETSILPYDDCCTVFVPERPQTKPDPERTARQEVNMDVERLINDAVAGIERIYVKAGVSRGFL